MDKMDVCFVVDTTGSMGSYLSSLTKFLPQFMHLTRILGNVDRISIISYKDYCDFNTIQTSGWHTEMEPVISYAKSLRASGGGDRPEAAKTAAKILIDQCLKPTIVIWYTDAPPHHRHGGSDPYNLCKESNALGDNFDWITLCKQLAKKCVRVFSFLSVKDSRTSSFYAMMAYYTSGNAMHLSCTSPDEIAKHTIGLFLGLDGQPYDFPREVTNLSLSNFDKSLAVNENDCDGFLPNTRGTNELTAETMSVDMLLIKSDRALTLPKRFESDESFKRKVFEVFDDILNADMILALTYNTVFGSLWRAICKSKNDDRRQKLLDKMGETVSILPTAEKENMKMYIAMSYDQSEKIDGIVSSAPVYPCVILQNERYLERHELMEISRSCNASILQKVSSILTGLIVVEYGKLPERYVPLGLAGKHIFGVLPHLMVAGTMFSRRPAAIMAILAVYTKSILEIQGFEFLRKIKGKWIDFSEPENMSIDFANLVLKVPDVLTDFEKTELETLVKVGGLAINKLTSLDIVRGYTSHKTVRPDYKVPCKKCNYNRSFTLLTDSGDCVFCASGDIDVPETISSDKSYWCECRSCNVHYAVVRVKDLNVNPKCHYCRFTNKAAPFVECSGCRNKFLCQNEQFRAHDYVCPPCEKNGSVVVTTDQTTVSEYLRQNGTEFLGLSVPNLDNFFESKSAFVARAKATLTDIVPLLTAKYDGKIVLNPVDIIENISRWIQRGTAEVGTCMICFSDFRKKELLSSCGKKSCGTVSCVNCLNNWYGSVRPGTLCLSPSLLCPFCKKSPSTKTLQRHNREACALRRLDLRNLDPTWYYGWCLQCYDIKPAVERACADDVPVLANFTCEDCRVNRRGTDSGPVISTRDCPKCGVKIWKTSGCNHIYCSNVINDTICGTHFCFECGHVSPEGEIYEHMRRQHGGIGLEYYDNIDSDGYDTDT